MLYFTVPRRSSPSRWKVSPWMQLYLCFQEILEASVWERLDDAQRVALVQALSRLMVKTTKREPTKENRNAGHE